MFGSFSYSITVITTVILFWKCLCETHKKGLALSEYIHHFEPLFYDHLQLQQHLKRTAMNKYFVLKFSAHNRFFKLRLKRDVSIFAGDTEFWNTDNTVSYDTSRALTGHLEDEENSFVNAVVTTGGLLDGVIKVDKEEFFIEPSQNYLQGPSDFHSVIYKLSDIRFPVGNLTCLSHSLHHLSSDSHLRKPSSSKKKKNFKTSAKERKRSVNVEGCKSNNCVAQKKNRTLRKHLHSTPTEHMKDSKRLARSRKLKIFRSFQPYKRSGHNKKSRASALQYRTRDDPNRYKIKIASNSLDPSYAKHHNSDDENVLSRNNPHKYPHPLDIGRNDHINNVLFFGIGREERNDNNSKVPKGETDLSWDKSPVVVSEDSHEDYARTNPTNRNCSFFNEVELVDSKVSKKEFIESGCQEIINSLLKERRHFEDPANHSSKDAPYWRELDALHYTEDGRTGSSEPYGVRSIQRTQRIEDRGQRHVAVDRRKSTCMLYLQADHLFYQKMGSEEACIEAMTRHVQRVNSIYRTADFDQDGRPDNISFLIKRIKVHTTPDYRFVGNFGVEKFLELFSEDDYDAFCLAYMFTYRDFEGGTLGLAWTGDLKNAGGVCEKNGHYRGSLKSLNTGIITLLNYGKHVPPVVSHVTLAHEIGHNFGSPHDPEDDQHCTPGSEHGNYIMFARATSGDKRNNNKFSPCSLRSINAVLNTKARSVKGCFTEPLDAVCGNEVLEGTEDCDCGWEEDCQEPCCFPMRVNPPHDQPPCRLKPSAFCSPSQGPCCSHDCRLKYGALCRADNGCRTASFCDGRVPQCPPSTKKPNQTICSKELVCYNGECTGSICTAYGLESCQCIRTLHDPIIRSCELCCKSPGDEFSCKSSFEWNIPPYDIPDLYAKPGAPCDNFNGYCDVYQYCREIDPSGPLATLRKLLLSPEGVVVLRKWIAEKWWGILLLFLAVALTVGISIRLLSCSQTKQFLSTILLQKSNFYFTRDNTSTYYKPTYLINPKTRATCVSHPRVSTAPENGWV